MVHTFLSKEAAGEDDIVSPELCFCLDVFGGRLVSSPMDYSLQSREMENFCEEFKEVWNQVNLG
ncbi:hypothetical protein [Pedobacter suwonensis]|uniref:hypothetical protein n=1 Tax=Pedobacter suwonensis TaxID=332999 RepID=UPI0011A577B1|nr:hypothetical protein [Pedobacter suwonensis]